MFADDYTPEDKKVNFSIRNLYFFVTFQQHEPLVNIKSIRYLGTGSFFLNFLSG